MLRMQGMWKQLTKQHLFVHADMQHVTRYPSHENLSSLTKFNIKCMKVREHFTMETEEDIMKMQVNPLFYSYNIMQVILYSWFLIY